MNRGKKQKTAAERTAELTYRGVVYRSGLEVTVAKALYAAKRKDKKLKFEFEPDHLEYRLASRLYVPDFKVFRADGSVIYIEVKGYLDRDSIRKMLAVKECHPDKTFVFLFSKNNPIRKGAKMRYSEWCDKHGFDYSFEELKEEWLTT